jgi:hypothetical protein
MGMYILEMYLGRTLTLPLRRVVGPSLVLS